MSKNLKLWLALPASIIATLLVAFILLAVLVDPNEYRDEIEAAAESAANIDLQIKGDIGWSLFPWIGFDINQIDIYTLDQLQKTEFIHLANASAELKLWPLLSGHIEVGALILSGFKLALIRDENGRSNWESVVKKPQTANTQNSNDRAVDKTKRSESAQNPKSEGTEKPDFSIAIAQIQITDAQIYFKDQVTDQKIDIDLIHLLASDINSDNTFPLQAAFALKNHSPEVSFEAEISSMMGISRGGYALYLKQLLMEGSVSGEPFNDKQIPLEIQGDMSLDRKTDALDIKSLVLKVANLPVVLKLQGETISTAPNFSGSVRIAEFNPKELMEMIGQPLPTLKDNSALTDLSMKANLLGSANQWTINDFKLKMDGSTLTGRLGISDLKTGALFWDLDLDHFDLDGYLPKGTDQTSDSDSQEAEQTGADQPLPIEMLRGLDLQGELRIGALEFGGMELSSLKLNVRAKDGEILIDPFQAEMYQGQLVLTAKANAQDELLKLDISSTLNGVQIQPLLESVMDVDLIEGLAALNAELSMQGTTVDQLINSLTGPGRLEVLNGKLKGTNLTEQTCKGVATVSQTTLAEYDWSPDTDFQQLGGSFQLSQGILKTPDMAIDLQSIKVTGDGWVNIPQSRLNYRLFLAVSGEQNLNGCSVSEKWQDFRWPVRCKGAFSDTPLSLCKLDTAEISRQIGKKAKKKLEQKTEQKLKTELKKLLKGF
ncbi:MAG: AsmA family protein [Pseudomonadales bacterium]|nr:AsmA family protein [Pseudomonadales bacterium]